VFRRSNYLALTRRWALFSSCSYAKSGGQILRTSWHVKPAACYCRKVLSVIDVELGQVRWKNIADVVTILKIKVIGVL